MSPHKQNPVDLLREFSIAELERVAQSYHDGLGDSFDVPIDIDILLEKTKGVDLDIWPGLKANHGLLGMVGTDDQNRIIVYSDDTLADMASMENRYRMTIAEELAHVILHKKAIISVKNPNDFLLIQEHKDWYKFERNAKRLAAAIIMPAGEVLKNASNLYSHIIAVLPANSKFSNVDLILNKITNLLAKKFIVSPQAMSYRLKEWPINVAQKVAEAVKERLDFLP